MVRVEDNICTYRYGEILHASAVLLKLFMSDTVSYTHLDVYKRQVLKNTLSDNGGVTRGICKMNEDYNLTEVVETKNIVKTAAGAEAEGMAVEMCIRDSWKSGCVD